MTNKPNCLSWAGGTAVQGIHNLGGTIGIPVPGRNSTQWTAVNEGWRWTPTGAPTYTINWVGPSGPIATGTQVTVCPLTTGVYTANATLGGCVGSSTISHTTQVVVSPGPTITANSASVCVGSGTTMTASGANTYTWQPGNIIGSSASFTPASTTVYTVTGTSASGCTGSVTTTITVNPLPVVTPTANTPICAGGTLNLSVGSASSYTWSGPNAFSSSAQSPTINNVTPVNAGNYSVSVTSTAGCKATNSIAVVVNPTVVLTPGNFGPYCVGSVINLTVAAASSYTWSGPNSFSSNFQNPAIANSQTIHAGTYTVNTTSAAGCKSTGTTNVIVNPKPTPTITSNSPLCQGSTLNLSVTPTAASYTWSGPNSFASNAQNPNVANVTTLSAGNYTVIMTSTAGCTGSAVANVVVNPTPTLTASNTGPYCPGATISLSVTTATSYTWSGPSVFNSNLQTPTIANSTTLNSGNYTVAISSAAGCANTAITNVVVNPAPTPTATSNSPVCVGKTITFTGLGGTTYTWTGPSGFSSNLQNPSITTASVANAGNYTLSVTNANGCTNSVVINVVINPLPVIAVNNPTTCVGSTFTLTATGGTAYAWTGPSSFNSALQNPPFSNATTAMSGNYTVVVTSAQGCTNNAVANASVVTSPTVSIVGTNTLCSQNFNSSINTTTLTANGGNTYTWTLPTGFSGSPNLNTSPITITPSVTSVQTVANVTVVGTVGTCTNSAVYSLTIVPNPTIAVTSGSLCAGKTLTLTSSGASTYTWSPSATLNTPNGNSVIASPAVTTVYSVIGTNAGCNSQTQTGTASVVPNPTVTIAPGAPLICLGSSINLSASGATTYTWSPNTALTTTNSANTTASPTITTTYSVLGSQATCTNLATAQVSVIGLPTVSIAGTTTLCSQNFNGSNNTTTLTASGAGTYVWTLPAGFSGSPNLTTNPVTITGPVTSLQTVATVTVLGTAGTCTNQAVYTITVVPNPTIAVTSGSMCAGTSVTLTSSGASTYTWSPSASLNTPNGNSVIASPAVTTVYSVIGTNAGCNSQTQTGTASVVPNPTVTIAPGAPLICLGSSINLSASGATNYTWSPNTALTTTNSANTTASPTITTTYSVLGSQATCTNLATVQVSVIGLPTVSIAGTTTLCSQNFNGSNNTTTLTASGAGTYVWTLPAGFSGSPNLSTNPITITGPVTSLQTVATVTVSGTAGTCTNQAVYTITVVPNPTIAVTSGSMCAGTSVTLTSSGASTYTWSPSASLNTPNGSSVIASPAVTTVYSVIGSSVGCNSQTQTGTATVVVNPTVTIAPGAPLICLGSSINLSASGATTYTWSPNTALTTTNSANTTASPTITTTYSVIGSQATCTNLATVQVSVIGLPTVSIAGTNTLCSQNFNGSNNTTTLTASGAGTYVWTLPAGFSGSPNLTTNPLTITGPVTSLQTVATVTVLGTAGTCTNQAVYTITVVPNPTIAVTSGSMCAGSSVTLRWSGA
ncbi:MAG: beta strand repeat-containing protein [Sphingobacteriaceae bacterium]